MGISYNLRRLQFLSLQNPNLWEFYITDAPSDMKFLVTEVALPFEKLETETRNTGTKHYTGFTPIEDFTITFRETTGFTVFNYLKAWMNEIYDPIQRVFISGVDANRIGTIAFEKPVFLFHAYSKIFTFNKLKIKGIGDQSLNYTTQDSLTITATFTVDEITEADTIPLLPKIKSPFKLTPQAQALLNKL